MSGGTFVVFMPTAADSCVSHYTCTLMFFIQKHKQSCTNISNYLVGLQKISFQHQHRNVHRYNSHLTGCAMSSEANSLKHDTRQLFCC